MASMAPPGYYASNPAVNQTALDAIEAQSTADNVPPWITVSIADAESGLNPNALGDYNKNKQPTSFGLFQLHQDGGQGDGYTQAQLLNPQTNAQIGVAPIAKAYQQGTALGLSGTNLLTYTADHSGHPDETGAMPASYQQRLLSAYNTLEQNGAQDLIPAPVTTAAGSTSLTASKILFVALGGVVAVVGLWAVLK